MIATPVPRPPETSRNFFADLGVRNKIGAVIALGVVLPIFSGLLANRALSRSAATVHHLYQDNLTSQTALAELQAVSIRTRVDLADLLVSLTGADDAKYEAAVRDGVTTTSPRSRPRR